MPERKRPTGRKKTYGNSDSGVSRKGSGLGGGPVGRGDGYSGRAGQGKGSAGKNKDLGGLGGGIDAGDILTGLGAAASIAHAVHESSGNSNGGGRRRNGGGCSGFLFIVIAVIIVAFILFSCADDLLEDDGSYSYNSGYSSTLSQNQSSAGSQESSFSNNSSDLSGLFGGSSSGGSFGGNYYSSSQSTQAVLNTDVSPKARSKYTKLSGDGSDTATVMVYMCGADLESKSGMATSDLQEMIAGAPSNINLIVFTGGAKSWNNNIVSSSVNQIYQVTGQGLRRLEDNAGTKAMTDPSNLASFVQYCKKNYPADRNILIFWNHGGGSVSGYGYDEKNSGSGSMTLDGIQSALTTGGMKFDIIGFDACLMGSLENGLMLSEFADYLVASEETEPGTGWYYTDWVNMLDSNTSVSTLELAKKIIDDYTSVSARQCPGQKTTLSVVDLAELETTVPSDFSSFSRKISSLIENKEYQTVSSARNGAREFASSSKIDQVDLVDLALKMGTEEGNALAETIKSAVKYNRTSTNMSNAYGVSIYFPYKKMSLVDSAVKTYDLIDLDSDYSKAIREFAQLEVSGQAAAGGSQAASPYGSLYGDYSQNYGTIEEIFGNTYSGQGSYSSYSDVFGSDSGSSYGSQDMISALIGALLTGDYRLIDGLDASNTAFLNDRLLPEETVKEYISDNCFDVTSLLWQSGKDGGHIMELSEKQWNLVQGLDLNMFYDDGSGYVDLGLDNVFEFDDSGNLCGDSDGTWLSINGQIVPYYHIDTTGNEDEYTITGRVPCFVNDTRMNLIIVFDTENEEGYIAGAVYDYENGETMTQAKNLSKLQEGDVIRFVCDYYSYDGRYLDSYQLGEDMSYTDDMIIRNDKVLGKVSVTYVFTDIYGQEYWTPAIVEDHSND